MTNQVRVIILPERTVISAEVGQVLTDAFRTAGISIENVCGGQGECGKCRVSIRKGKSSQLPGESARHLWPHGGDDGSVLACRTVVLGDLEVRIPAESRIISPRILSDHPDIAPLSHPVIRVYPVLHTCGDALSLPFGTRSFQLSGYQGPRPFLPRDLYERLVTSENPDFAIVTGTGGFPEVIEVLDRAHADRVLGVAIDLGTTTVAGVLVDLVTNQVLAGSSGLNRQIVFGEEVITRISHAKSPQGLEELSKAAVASVSAVVDSMISTAGIRPAQIAEVALSANTVMTTLAFGRDPRGLDMPDAVVDRSPVVARAGDLGISVPFRRYVYSLPSVSRFIGGDVVGGVLVSGMAESHEPSLLLDLGTNGEIVIGNEEILASTSVAAGPAFEGAGLAYGMRAMDGAIDHVRCGADPERAVISVIGNSKPMGMCGSGIIDAAVFMFKAGILDFAGKICPLSPHVREGGAGYEWVLVPAGETAHGREIVISQQDINYLMDSKAATLGAVAVLMKKVRYQVHDIRNVYLAGAFGAYSDISSLVDFGIIPRFSRARVVPLGNSSLAGARAALISTAMRAEAEQIAKEMIYFDLLVDTDFIEEYRSALYIPGRSELFPPGPP